MNEASLMHTLELADRLIRQLQRDVLARDRRIRWCDQRIEQLEQQLADAHERRDQAEQLAADCEQEIEAAGSREAPLEERIRELEAEVQGYGAHPEVTSSGPFDDENAVEAFEFLDDEQQEALRYRIRCEQAVRARLGKTDMSPSARVRTLKQAKRLGLLDPHLRAELRELQDDGW